MKYTRGLASTLLAATSLMAFGWGQKGHDTVAYIAECHLSPEAKSAADSLLDGKSIVYWANWLDNASHTPDYAYSKTWHYKNIDEGVEFMEAPLNPSGDVVTAISEQLAILSDTTQSKEARALALKMVVHLTGDIHQPMHMGHASDLGGNRWQVKYFNSPKNLHSVWDSNILEGGHKWSYTEWQQQIDRATPEEAAIIISSLNPADWGAETFEIANTIYATTPEGTNIEYSYIADWTPVIEQQLLKGGLRLAAVLNEALSAQSHASDKK